MQNLVRKYQFLLNKLKEGSRANTINPEYKIEIIDRMNKLVDSPSDVNAKQLQAIYQKALSKVFTTQYPPVQYTPIANVAYVNKYKAQSGGSAINFGLNFIGSIDEVVDGDHLSLLYDVYYSKVKGQKGQKILSDYYASILYYDDIMTHKDDVDVYPNLEGFYTFIAKDKQERYEVTAPQIELKYTDQAIYVNGGTLFLTREADRNLNVWTQTNYDPNYNLWAKQEYYIRYTVDSIISNAQPLKVDLDTAKVSVVEKHIFGQNTQAYTT